MRGINLFGATCVVLFLVPAVPVTGQAPGTALLPTGIVRPCFPAAGTHRVFVQGERLEAAYGLLLERSPTFAQAVSAIEASNMVRIRVGYRDQVMETWERQFGEDRSGAVFLADGTHFHPAGTIVCGVRVVFFTEGLEEELIRRGVPESAVVEDLAVMLAHEVYGHLVPFAEQGVTAWPTPCRDPAGRRGRRATGCAVDRENVIREEMGFSLRVTYASVEGPLACELTRKSCRFAGPGRLAAVRTLAATPPPSVRPMVASGRTRPGV
jgi:hypothetical protein